MAQRTEKVAEILARQILQDIRRNGLGPGSMLPAESTMVEQYGAGRGSVREALRILEVNGLVTLKPGPRGGPVVAPHDPGDFGQMMTLHLQSRGATYRQLLEARLEYEVVLARKAAEQPGEEFEFQGIVDPTFTLKFTKPGTYKITMGYQFYPVHYVMSKGSRKVAMLKDAPSISVASNALTLILE